jgi:hypothetical protein
MTVATHNSKVASPTPSPPTQAAPICSVASDSAPTNSLPAETVPADSEAAGPVPTVLVPAEPPIATMNQYPNGDFRNSSRETVRDIQSTIMVNWLRQMQMEKLWSVGSPGEGVILKKDRDSYVCCPETLKDHSPLFYNQVVGMNVRVCSNFHSAQMNAANKSQVYHHSEHSCHKSVLGAALGRLCPSHRRPPITSLTFRGSSIWMQETPLWGIHKRPTTSRCLG